MKKKQLTANQVLAIKNSFSPEGQKAADAIVEAINAMGGEETEYSVEELQEKVNALCEEAKSLTEEEREVVENMIALQLKNITNVANKKNVSREVKNEVIKAILEGAKSGAELRDNVRAIAVKNGIDGLTFEDVIDYDIQDKFGAENWLFDRLHKTEFNKFFYTEADMNDAKAIAKGWLKTNEGQKAIQQLTTKGKKIDTQYVYKIQSMAAEDLARIRKAGKENTIIGYVTNELRRVVVNTKVMAILVGDSVNQGNAQVTSFESIGTKTATDAFTLVQTASAAELTVKEIRLLADQLHNPFGHEKVAVMCATQKTKLAAYRYAAGGDEYYRTDAELAGQLGVDAIYTTSLVPEGGVILLIPEEYWVLEEDEIDVAYPKYEENKVNWQYESLSGGAIHGLASTAVLRPKGGSGSSK